MAKGFGAVHVTTQRRHYVGKDGVPRVYETNLLRRSYRRDGKVRNETVANLSALPPEAIDAVRACLAGKALVQAGTGFTITRSLPHGHLAAVWAVAQQLGLPALLGPVGRMRDLALALIISRAVAPASKLATLTAWDDVTLGVDLGVAGASTDEVYAALDYLLDRQEVIEKNLAARYLDPAVNPSRMALYDLSSSWMTGSKCPLAKRGYSRDGKKDLPQIEYALLTDPAGCPVAVRVFEGNTADPAALAAAVTAVKDTFALQNMVLVGDRGMITTARIRALQQVGGLGWVTALRAPQIAALAADTGPLQMSLFDQQNFAEIAHPDYPGERLIACRNPALAELRTRKRQELLAATEALLAPAQAAVTAGRLTGADKIGLRVGRLLGKHKMGKHFRVTITDTTLTVTRDQAGIDAEAALDGIYVIRGTPLPEALDTPDMIRAYKSLANVEKDFRSIKTIDIDLRPVYHHLEGRVRGHVFLCFLAAHLTWHLRRTLAELTYTDETPLTREDPVAPAVRSQAAKTKTNNRTSTTGLPLHTYQDLLNHLATLTRNDIRYGSNGPVIPTLAEPTPVQRRVFDLLGTPVPTTLN
ncbi:MAG TPA: IS1634 family transposase [Streptosporangiaceae bacterium]|nr:IS1634 family transposase [Streptosporangiaceae bacterium]